MRVEYSEARVWRALDVHARYPIPARGARVEHLEVLLLPVAVLPLRLLGQHQLLLVVTDVIVLQFLIVKIQSRYF